MLFRSSRNRSILIGLIKDFSNSLATRFELRSPSPHNNVYLILASCYQAIRDGLWNAAMNMSLEQLEKEFSKNEKEDGIYLEQGREYRSEKNIFEYYSEDERYRKFGIPPKTVYENLLHFQQFPDKLSVLKKDDIFTTYSIFRKRDFIPCPLYMIEAQKYTNVKHAKTNSRNGCDGRFLTSPEAPRSYSGGRCPGNTR